MSYHKVLVDVVAGAVGDCVITTCPVQAVVCTVESGNVNVPSAPRLSVLPLLTNVLVVAKPPPCCIPNTSLVNVTVVLNVTSLLVEDTVTNGELYVLAGVL